MKCCRILLTVLMPLSLFMAGCSSQHQLGKAAHRLLFSDTVMKHAHVGIAIYDPQQSKSLFQYNAEKYFVPASNTKIISCYAGMKYLGDSLNGLRYAYSGDAVWVRPTGDPTLLHADYRAQPVLEFLRQQVRPVYVVQDNWKTAPLGQGWSWEDYNYSYMVERSALPVYGNYISWYQEVLKDAITGQPSVSVYSQPEISWKVRFDPDEKATNFYVERARDENTFLIREGKEGSARQDVPFVTQGISAALQLLNDTVGKQISMASGSIKITEPFMTIKSRPTDSLLRPMMHASDNFFAEQILLMASDNLLGFMDETKVIDTILKTDLKDLPQPPHWADGSGLSRYNLFSPMDFVYVLDKMQKEFGLERVKTLFPSGGYGTLKGYYKNIASSIYAKTGSLGGVICLSGYLRTRRGRWLLFSVLVNNHQGTSQHIRRKVESYLQKVYDRY